MIFLRFKGGKEGWEAGDDSKSLESREEIL